MVSSDPTDEEFTLEAPEYWVKAVQPDAVDSSDFGPVDAMDHILAAGALQQKIPFDQQLDAGKADDKVDQWVIPLVPSPDAGFGLVVENDRKQRLGEHGYRMRPLSQPAADPIVKPAL